MWLRITFGDGSEPVYRSGTELELQAEMRRWKQDYYLTIHAVWNDPGNYLGGVRGYEVTAKKKPPKWRR